MTKNYNVQSLSSSSSCTEYVLEVQPSFVTLVQLSASASFRSLGTLESQQNKHP